MATESFTAADGTLVSALSGWFTPSGATSCRVMSNACAGSVVFGPSVNGHTGTWAEAHRATKVLASLAGGTGADGVAIRVQTDANSYLYCLVDFTGPTVYNGQCIAGTTTDWDSGLTGANAPSVGQRYGLEADPGDPTTIHFTIDDVIITSYTGKNALSGGAPGVAMYHNADAVRGDDWIGEDVTTATATLGWMGA